MSDIETLKEELRITQTRLDLNIKLKKSERINLEEKKAALLRGIECINIVERMDCQNGKY